MMLFISHLWEMVPLRLSIYRSLGADIVRFLSSLILLINQME